MLYWIISYVCCLCFRFPYDSLVFTLDPGHYISKSMCSSPKGLLFTPNYVSGFVPVLGLQGFKESASARCHYKLKTAARVLGFNTFEGSGYLRCYVLTLSDFLSSAQI